MEIEVGEYVRTKNGDITKIIRYYEEANLYQCKNGMFIDIENNIGLHIADIVKHSKNLIDLIAIKDIVKFKNKLPNSLENEEMIIHIFDKDTLNEVKEAIQKQEIELLSILTHEQYEQNCYRLEE